jgi:Hint module
LKSFFSRYSRISHFIFVFWTFFAVYEPANDLSVLPSPSPSDTGSCFPGDSKVLLASGDYVRVDKLAIGDRVHIGGGLFSAVFMFTHRMAGINQQFVAIESSSGAVLRATAGHYLYVNGDIKAAGSVRVGDLLELENGDKDAVYSVTFVSGDGLYNPQTVNGDIVVDGIRASTYTTAIEPMFAHAILAPLRAMYSTLGWYSSLLDDGSSMSHVFPSGARCL